MFGERHDPEFLKHLFERTEILRKPITGIIAGYHVLPYILVGPQEEQPHRSVEIRGQIERAMDELAMREVINTGVIMAPNVRFYPVSLDRFITEILDQEFRS